MKDTIKLMIVDDSSIIRKLLQNYLDDYNIEIVGEASDGLMGLEMFKKMRPNVITMDIIMPEMDGLTVIEEIMKIDNTVKIMVISALSDKATGIEAIKKGAKSYVVKPFTPEKIHNAFAKMINQ